MSNHAKELVDVMTVPESEDVEFQAKLDSIDAQPDGVDTVEITGRERLELLFPKSFIDTLDDAEVAEQVAIMDEANDVAEVEASNDVCGNCEADVQIPEQSVVPDPVVVSDVAIAESLTPSPVKRGRGRPKGSKNKPKNVN